MSIGPGVLPAPRYVRCARCLVPQPLPGGGPSRCVACGAPFQRWIAHPPPATGQQVAATPARPSRPGPYTGPPSYRGAHPSWSFPPVVWRELPTADPHPPVRDPAPALRLAGWFALATAVLALFAAGAEIWRFVLLLQGRTLVLSGPVVAASDVVVAAGGLAVVVAALLTAAVAVPALLRAHSAVALRIGRLPARRPVSVLARLLVPVWNIYGAGQIVTEIDRTLTADADEPPKASRLTTAWWLSWVLSAEVVAATLWRGRDGSLQAIADTVELHIALDLLAAVVAGLGFLLLRRFATLFTGRRSEFDGWQVQPPAPTRPLAAEKSVAAD